MYSGEKQNSAVLNYYRRKKNKSQNGIGRVVNSLLLLKNAREHKTARQEFLVLL